MQALQSSKTPLAPPTPPAQPPAIDLDTAQLDQIIGAKGTNNGGIYAFGVPRRDLSSMFDAAEAAVTEPAVPPGLLA